MSTVKKLERVRELMRQAFDRCLYSVRHSENKAKLDRRFKRLQRLAIIFNKICEEKNLKGQLE